jgi:3,4-dihydroxy 2-butanone 4-phosphate synthase/GTP cyclohydrolase II
VLPAKLPHHPAARADLRNYGIGAQILKDLNVRKMRLLAVPRKMPSMAGFGLEVTGYLEPEDKSRLAEGRQAVR